MNAFKITLYIACVVIGVQQASETIACGTGCTRNSNLDTCNNDKGNWINGYMVASKNSVDLLQDLITKFDFRKSESCFGQNNKLECPAGKVISILHASDGLIANHICTTEKKTDLCIAPREDVMSWIPTWCEGAPSCTIPWNDNRPDPCRWTSKVLSIYYLCITPQCQG